MANFFKAQPSGRLTAASLYKQSKWSNTHVVSNQAFFGGLISRRALVLNAGVLAEVTAAQLGTGLKPVVVMSDGTRKQRATTEGTPLVLVNGVVRGLNTSSESLLI